MLSPKRTEYGKEIRKAYEKGEIHEKRRYIQQLEPRDDGIANCVTTVQKDCLILAKVVDMIPKELKEVADEEDLEVVEEKPKEGESLWDYLYHAKDGEYYGIFKLTPRECGRLMDVSDENITKMLDTNSRTQCYKQFGNSIVCNVLVAIFGQLFEGKEREYRKGGLVENDLR